MNDVAGATSKRDVDDPPSPRRDGPTHPVWKANLVMLGVVVLLLVLSLLSVFGGP